MYNEPKYVFYTLSNLNSKNGICKMNREGKARSGKNVFFLGNKKDGGLP